MAAPAGVGHNESEQCSPTPRTDHDAMNPAQRLAPTSLAASRRDFLLGSGCGALALSWLLARDGRAASRPRNPLAARPPHRRARARSVIFLFMVGGPSHLDLFDPKPALRKHQGKPLPASFGRPVSQFTKGDTPLLASTRTFRKHGASGLEMSDLLPHLAGCVDDLCYLRSCWG